MIKRTIFLLKNLTNTYFTASPVCLSVSGKISPFSGVPIGWTECLTPTPELNSNVDGRIEIVSVLAGKLKKMCVYYKKKTI